MKHFRQLASLSFVALGLLTQAGLASAQQLTEAQGRAIVAPFYDALNQPAKKDVPSLLASATTDAYVSCGNNETCNPRDRVAGTFAFFGKAVPDLKWEIKELLVSGNRVIVRGEATGTPAGELFGVPHSGRSFKTMSIDIHTVEGGKIARSYHVEDWSSVIRQLRGQ